MDETLMGVVAQSALAKWGDPKLGIVVRRLASTTSLSAEDYDALGAGLSEPIEYHAGHELLPKGHVLNKPKFLLTGWAALSVYLADGRRQIVDIFLPGDLVAYSAQPSIAKGSYHALTTARCVEARLAVDLSSHGELPEGIRHGLQNLEEEQHARLVENVVRNGRMSSHERFAHLVAELFHRLDKVGLVTAGSFAMPLTQETIGDVLGISAVHVNRTVQYFRRENILKAFPGRWQVADHALLNSFAAGEHGRLD